LSFLSKFHLLKKLMVKSVKSVAIVLYLFELNSPHKKYAQKMLEITASPSVSSRMLGQMGMSASARVLLTQKPMRGGG